MIQEFVDKFMESKSVLENMFRAKHPENYKAVVESVVSILDLSLERIHEIDDGNYQGTLIYVIGESDYQPSHYWYVKIDYGSCSGCDTLERIKNYEDENPPNEEQVSDYMTLALHIVQGLEEMD